MHVYASVFFLFFLQLVFQVIFLPLVAAQINSLPGCQDRCGNVSIPYPFGMGGQNCYYNEWFAISCVRSSSNYPPRPYLSAVNLEVLVISLENQTVTVNSSVISDCQNPIQNSSQVLGTDLDGSPFLVSREHNRFTAVGCGNAVVRDQQKVISGCSSICNGTSTTVAPVINKGCFGIDCCQNTIRYYLTRYSVDITGLEERGGGCGSAFLVEENWWEASDQLLVENYSFVPIALLWIIMEHPDGVDCSNLRLDLGNGTSLETWQCKCQFAQRGDPYLPNGCQGVEECAGCAECQFYQGRYSCVNYDNQIIRRGSSKIGIILGVSISVGVLLLITCVFLLYKVVKKTIDKRRKERFFKRNGGLLLQQQVSANEGLVDKTTKVFPSRELEKATDYFNKNRILGIGGQGTVYKGMLTDGRIIAVKKSKLVDESQLEQFINEVVILSQINHRNVVKLLGCCLETEVPLLVSEFISNGTLFEHLHDESDEFPISWNMRLQIAKDVAGALAYLHSSTSVHIFHRDIKSSNILLDDKYRAKVSDFGTSKFAADDKTHLSTLVKGTFGYLDPEYFQSSQFTEKSDVYSFGVVLVELITGQRPISSTRSGEHRGLATHFIMSMEEGHLFSILDARVVKEAAAEELVAVADLAKRCLSLNGKSRPTMKEVATTLEGIKKSHMPPTVPIDFQEVTQLSFSYSDSTSTSIT